MFIKVHQLLNSSPHSTHYFNGYFWGKPGSASFSLIFSHQWSLSWAFSQDKPKLSILSISRTKSSTDIPSTGFPLPPPHTTLKLSGWHTLKKLVPETCTKQSWIILGASFWYKFLECVSPLLDSIICVSPLLVSIISAFNMSKWVPLQNKNSPPHSYRGKTNPLHQEKHEERLTLRLSRLWIDSVAMATSLETSATTSW